MCRPHRCSSHIVVEPAGRSILMRTLAIRYTKLQQLLRIQILSVDEPCFAKAIYIRLLPIPSDSKFFQARQIREECARL